MATCRGPAQLPAFKCQAFCSIFFAGLMILGSSQPVVPQSPNSVCAGLLTEAFHVEQGSDEDLFWDLESQGCLNVGSLSFPVIKTRNRREARGNALHFLISLVAASSQYTAEEILEMKEGMNLEEAAQNLRGGLSPSELSRCGMQDILTVSHKALVCSYKSRVLKAIRTISRHGSFRAVMINEEDSLGYTPLSHAISEGMEWVVRELLAYGSDPNIGRDVLGRSALHAALHDDHLYRLLLAHDADINSRDMFGRTVAEIRGQSKGGACLFSAAEREAKQGACENEPEHGEDNDDTLSKHNDAPVPQPLEASFGWTAALEGSSSRAAINQGFCNIETRHMSEMSPTILIRDFMYTQRPVLIRAAYIDDEAGWRQRFRSMWGRDKFVEKFGDLKSQVGKIPYPEKFGSIFQYETNIRDYVSDTMPNNFSQNGNDEDVKGQRVDTLAKETEVKYQSQQEGGANTNRSRPPYFVLSDECGEWGLIKSETQRKATRNIMREILDQFPPLSRHFLASASSYCLQLFLGPDGSGSPIHFHHQAFNLVTFGAKRWRFLPPSHRIYDKGSSRDFWRTVSDKRQHELDEARSQSENVGNLDEAGDAHRHLYDLECVQKEGDLLYIPARWSHSVENLGDTASVAMELIMRMEVIASIAATL